MWPFTACVRYNWGYGGRCTRTRRGSVSQWGRKEGGLGQKELFWETLSLLGFVFWVSPNSHGSKYLVKPASRIRHLNSDCVSTPWSNSGMPAFQSLQGSKCSMPALSAWCQWAGSCLMNLYHCENTYNPVLLTRKLFGIAIIYFWFWQFLIFGTC